MQLTKGSRGDDVKKLQQMLREAGYFTYKNNTGYFGDLTEQALKKFQAARGIKVDGIYGPASEDALTNDGKIRTMLANPNLTAQQKEMLQNMYTQGDHRVNAFSMGTVMLPSDFSSKTTNIENAVANANPLQQKTILTGNGTELGQDAIDGSKKMQRDTVSPYFDAAFRKDQAAENQSIGNQNRAYNNNVMSLDQSLKDDITKFYDTEANSGVLGSGSRAERLASIKNKYNINYSDAYNQAQNGLFNTRLDYAYNYGDDAALQNNSPITRYQVDPTQTGANQTTVETGGQYDPFKLYGTQNSAKENAIDSLSTNNQLNTQQIAEKNRNAYIQ